MRNIFGREPAAIAAAIQSVTALAIAFGWLAGIGLSTQDDLAVVLSVESALFAVYLAAVTTETLLAPLVELFKAALALAAIYGYHMTAEQTASVIAAITALLAAWQRSQVAPLTRGTFDYIAPDDTGAVAVKRTEAGNTGNALVWGVVAALAFIVVVWLIVPALRGA